MTGRLEGKVALITGTASGMGRAAAVRFAQEGALVIGCDLSEDGNRETVELVAETGAKMTGMAPVDLGDPEAARTWVEESAAVHGRIDVVFNNASSPRFAPLPDLSVEDWRYAMRNELDLVFYVTKFAWPHLAERGGVVINTASTSAYVATPGQGFAAHCAAKGGCWRSPARSRPTAPRTGSAPSRSAPAPSRPPSSTATTSPNTRARSRS